MEALVKAGVFLAVRSPRDSFYLCRLDETIQLDPSKYYNITWLQKTNKRENYIISKADRISGATVICEVNLEKLSRFTYNLSEEGLNFIKNEIKFILKEERYEKEESNGSVQVEENNSFEENKLTETSQINQTMQEQSVCGSNQEQIPEERLVKIIQNITLDPCKEEQMMEQNEQVNLNVQAVNRISHSSDKNMHDADTKEPNEDSDCNEPYEDSDKNYSAYKDENSKKQKRRKIIKVQKISYKNKLQRKNEQVYLNVETVNRASHSSDKNMHNTDSEGPNEDSGGDEPYEDSGSDYSVYKDENSMKQKRIKMVKVQKISYKNKLKMVKVQKISYKNKLKTRNELVQLNVETVDRVSHSSDKNMQNIDSDKPNDDSGGDEPYKDSGSDYSAYTDENSTKQRRKIGKAQRNKLQTNKKHSLKQSIQITRKSSNLKGLNDEVTFGISTKTDDEKRIYNKRHSCYICYEKFIKMARHLELKHKDESAVSKLLAMDKNSPQRKTGFLQLIRVGDYYHNIEVLTSRRGELILCRRPCEATARALTYDKFGPCPYCLGFMVKSYLFVHVKKCTSKNINDTNIQKSIQVASNALINSIIFDGDKGFRKYILDCLKNDEISTLCKSDKVILGLGCMLFEKHGTTQNDLIRQSMRQLGRLLQNIHENHPDYKSKDLSFFITPAHFDSIIKSVKSLCEAKSKYMEKMEYGIPSLALKIGHSLRKCIGFLRGQALRAGLIDTDIKLKSFLDILDMEWDIRISSNALNTMHTRKMNNTDLLPLTDDLLVLNKFISNEINIFKVLLQNNPCEKDAWVRLAEATLARIILFNKRRGGEVARMTLTQYSSSPDWSKESTQELQNSLTSVEKELANTLKLIQIRGKRGRTVPVILTEEMVSAINLLISTRFSVGIPLSNMYVFARVYNESLSYIRGPDALRSIVNKSNLQCPKSITSTRLRKYIATVSQVFNLKETEVDWLARHLGHDVRVHRDFYRLQESAVELSKISRLLMTVDEGQVSKFKGRSLEEINLKDLPDISEESEISDGEVEVDEEDQLPYNSSKPDEHQNMSLSDKVSTKGKGGRKRPVRWCADESQAVLKYFRVQIKTKIVPGKILCEKCINESKGILNKRSWRDIKYYVKNQISKISKTCSYEQKKK